MTSPEPTSDAPSLITAYRIGVGIAVPVLIVLIGIVGKKVARGPGWQEEDISVGSELTLAGVSGALVNLLEFLKPDRVNFGALEKKLLGGNIGIAILGLLFYYLGLSFRQDFGPDSNKSAGTRRFMMLVVSNIMGFVILLGALLLMAP